ncbi:MAG TPA: hypothetical protein DCL29_00320 [Eubacterium sp.]|nr:hypothetical protein [Eubacterium sp.]
MRIILGVIIGYIIIGIIFGIRMYLLLLKENDLPEKMSNIVLLFSVCIICWIIFTPFIPYTIYKHIKRRKK